MTTTSTELIAILRVSWALICAGISPEYLICDCSSQFDCDGFRRWCRRQKIRPRYGAVGQHGC